MTDITAKPFDWNDNLSKEALEDFEGIRKDLPYCTCQNIGMALAKLELLEKQGCKVIDPSGSSSEKPNKSGQWIERVERDDWDDYEEVWYECDQCHTDWGGAVNFCPNCGARMVEPQEGGDQA